MSKKEAAARLKINKLLEEAGWRLVDGDDGRANVDVETRLNPDEYTNLHAAGEDFEYARGGFIDYLLLDENQKPIAVLEAKRESIPPLSAKEQARKYEKRNPRIELINQQELQGLLNEYMGTNWSAHLIHAIQESQKRHPAEKRV